MGGTCCSYQAIHALSISFLWFFAIAKNLSIFLGMMMTRNYFERLEGEMVWLTILSLKPPDNVANNKPHALLIFSMLRDDHWELACSRCFIMLCFSMRDRACSSCTSPYGLWAVGGTSHFMVASVLVLAAFYSCSPRAMNSLTNSPSECSATAYKERWREWGGPGKMQCTAKIAESSDAWNWCP